MIELLADEYPDREKARCCDCGHLEGAVTLWCTSAEAREINGGQVGYHKCPFWRPMRAVEGVKMPLPDDIQ